MLGVPEEKTGVATNTSGEDHVWTWLRSSSRLRTYSEQRALDTLGFHGVCGEFRGVRVVQASSAPTDCRKHE